MPLPSIVGKTGKHRISKYFAFFDISPAASSSGGAIFLTIKWASFANAKP